MSTVEETVESTDILARKQGRFELFDLVGAKITSSMQNPELRTTETVESPTEAEKLVLTFRSVDGKQIVIEPKTTFVTYNSQTKILKNILSNRYAYLDVGDNRSRITPTEGDARSISQQNKTHPIVRLSREISEEFRQYFEMKVGNRKETTTDRFNANYIGCPSYEGSDQVNIEVKPNVNQYIDLIDSVAGRPTKCTVVNAEDPNRLLVEIDGNVYPVHFDGRPTTNDHTPTGLAERLGVRVPENLENEQLLVASGKYQYKNTNYDFVGTNRAETLVFGRL